MQTQANGSADPAVDESALPGAASGTEDEAANGADQGAEDSEDEADETPRYTEKQFKEHFSRAQSAIDKAAAERQRQADERHEREKEELRAELEALRGRVNAPKFDSIEEELEYRRQKDDAEVATRLMTLKTERFIEDVLKEASEKAGVEIKRDDPRLKFLKGGKEAKEVFLTSVERIVAEESVKKSAASEREALLKKLAELEERGANPMRDRFDTGGRRGATRADLENLSAKDKIALALERSGR